MINVLQLISTTGLYGAERWVLALSRNLNSDLVQCSLATPSEPGEGTDFHQLFRENGLVSYKCRMRSRFDPLVILGICNVIKRERIQIVHSHGYKSDILALLAAKLQGVRTVATPHGFENAADRKLQLFIRLGCAALRHFDCVTPLSDALANDMQRLGIREDKLRLILNGVDLDEIDRQVVVDATDPQNASPLKTIVYVGQLIERKNVSDLIRAFHLLSQERSDVRLLIIGDGPSRRNLEELAASFNLTSRILFTGYRNNRLELLKETHLFSMTSSLEGIPRCMMEAMAMRIPVAAFNIPGVDKLILHEKTGLMAELGDVMGLKQCFNRILSNPQFAMQLARDARRHIDQYYSARRMACEFTELYQQLANGTTRRPNG